MAWQVFTRRCVDYTASSPNAGSGVAGIGYGAGQRNRPEDACYTDWMMSYRASIEEIEPDFLFLGNIKARDPDLLNQLGIRYVLNAANADLDEMAPLPMAQEQAEGGGFQVFTLNLLDGTQLSAEDGRVCDGLAFIDEVQILRTTHTHPRTSLSGAASCIYLDAALLPLRRNLHDVAAVPHATCCASHRRNGMGRRFWSTVRSARIGRPRCCWHGC